MFVSSIRCYPYSLEHAPGLIRTSSMTLIHSCHAEGLKCRESMEAQPSESAVAFSEAVSFKITLGRWGDTWCDFVLCPTIPAQRKLQEIWIEHG